MTGQWRKRIGVRAAVPAVVLVLGVVVVLGALQLAAVERRRQEALESYADLLGQLVLSNLHDAMLTKDRRLIQTQLSRLIDIHPIVQVRVLGKSGKVAYASDVRAVGQVLSREEPSCRACHPREGGLARQRGATLALPDPAGRTVFRSIQPIRLAPECGGQCHRQPQGSVLGIVMTDLDHDAVVGSLRLQATSSLWVLAGSALLILAVLVIVLRRLVVSRLLGLGRLLELLRSGARVTPLAAASGDEIDELSRTVQALALDLDERLALERAQGRIQSVLERCHAPLLLTDVSGQVLAANDRARRVLGAEAVRPGQLQSHPLAGDDPPKVAAQDRSEPKGHGPTGPMVVPFCDGSGAPLGLADLWPPGDGDDRGDAGAGGSDGAAGRVRSDHDSGGAGSDPDGGGAGDDGNHDVAPAPIPRGPDTSPVWLTYGAVLTESVIAPARRPRGLLGFDPRLTLARRLLSDLAELGLEARAEREEIDLASLCALALGDVRRRYPAVRWQVMLPVLPRVLGRRYQLRALLMRLLDAAGRQAGPGGDALVFARAGKPSGNAFVGVWASCPGGGALVDPLPGPPLAAAIARAQGGKLEVDPAYDIGLLAQASDMRLPTERVGTLFLVELA